MATTPTKQEPSVAESETTKPKFDVSSNPSSVAPKPVAPEIATKKQEIHTKIVEILAKHNGMESEIPLSNEYWGLVNEYRAL